MAKNLSKDVMIAYQRIQDVAKNASRTASRSNAVMNRDFVLGEKADIEDALVVLEIYAEERGYRRGFERGVRSAAERDAQVASSTSDHPASEITPTSELENR